GYYDESFFYCSNARRPTQKVRMGRKDERDVTDCVDEVSPEAPSKSPPGSLGSLVTALDCAGEEYGQELRRASLFVAAGKFHMLRRRCHGWRSPSSRPASAAAFPCSERRGGGLAHQPSGTRAQSRRKTIADRPSAILKPFAVTLRAAYAPIPAAAASTGIT